MDWTTLFITWIVPIVAFLWTPGCYCVVTDCVLFSDNFDRADSGSLGADWVEDVGVWDIAGNLLVTSSSNAVAHYTPSNTATPQRAVRAIVQASNSGDQARLMLAHTGGGDFTFAQLTFGTNKIGIYEHIGGVDTLLKECDFTLATATDYDAVFVADRYDIANAIDNVSEYDSALYIDGNLVLAAPHSGNSGTAGVATGTVTGTVSFNDFEVRKAQFEDTDCENALACCWPNCGQLRVDMPAQMRFVLTGYDFFGNVMDGTYDCDLVDYTDSSKYPIQYCGVYRLDGLTGLGCDDGTFTGCAPTFIEVRIGAFGGSRVCTVAVQFGSGCLGGTFDASLDDTTGPVTLTMAGTGCGSVHLIGTMTVEAL